MPLKKVNIQEAIDKLRETVNKEKKYVASDLKEFECHAKILIDKTLEQDDKTFIEGWASTVNLDRHGEVVSTDAFKGTIKKFLKNPVLLFMHNPFTPIGKITEIRIDEDGKNSGLWIRAYISKTAGDIITLIKEGILKAFSIGFRQLKDDKDEDTGVITITGLELYEVSVVSIPANRESLFSLTKALKWGSDMFSPLTIENKNNMGGALVEPGADDVIDPPDKPAKDKGAQRQREALQEFDRVFDEIVGELKGETKTASQKIVDDYFEVMRKRKVKK